MYTEINIFCPKFYKKNQKIKIFKIHVGYELKYHKVIVGYLWRAHTYLNFQQKIVLPCISIYFCKFNLSLRSALFFWGSVTSQCFNQENLRQDSFFFSIIIKIYFKSVHITVRFTSALPETVSQKTTETEFQNDVIDGSRKKVSINC